MLGRIDSRARQGGGGEGLSCPLTRQSQAWSGDIARCATILGNACWHRRRAVLEILLSSPLYGKERLWNSAFIPRPERLDGDHSAQKKKPIGTSGYPCHPLPPWKAGITFICQSICNSPYPSPTNYISPQDKGPWDLALLALWPNGLRPPALWPHTHLLPQLCCPGSHHPCTWHPGLWPPLSCFVLDLCLSPPPPPGALTRPLLSHKGRSPVNSACTLIDSLICNSLLPWRKEPSCWEFLLL